TDSNKLEYVHSYIGLEVTLKSAPGRLGYSYDTDGPVNEFTYNATYVFEDNASDPRDRTVKLFRDVYFGQAVQIAIHAEIVD
ncbi:MAG: hypothetical protein PHV88_03600, partial [Eubacteriales bacterium]|nr:hypothetical protein [Eubacteriales bacterium]